jgi:arylsulfatase A-like enzyme
MSRIVLAILSLFLVRFAVADRTAGVTAEKPNVIIIFADDQGYGDLSCFGSTLVETPHIDRMAEEGRRLTNFMVASPVCTPSRAALLTGSYPKRIGLAQGVLFPGSERGLHPGEHTIADHLKAQGYVTACFGKWHLGDHPETLPRQHGFDVYFGIPYSNDMNHPDNKNKPRGGHSGMDALWSDPESTLSKWNTPLIENETIVELPADQRTITRRYTDRAIDFICENQDQPFFVYLPHSMPHIPLYVPDEVYGADPTKAYKLVIEHIDAEVGRLLDSLRELDLDEETIVIYTSDNGPWLSYKHHGGSAGTLRDGKGTTFEGGMRVPCIVWGPSRIPAGVVCDELVTTLDLLPTITALTGVELPADRTIDGLDASALLTGAESVSPRREFLYYSRGGLIEGIRVDQWKLLVKPRGGRKAAKQEPVVMLFDLEKDPGERRELSAANPEVVESLQARMAELDAEIAQNKRAAWGKE